MYAHSGGMWPGDSAETRAPRARRHAKIQITAKLCRRASGLGWSRDSPTPTSVSAVVCTAQLSTYWTRCMKPWSARYLNANRSDRPQSAVAGRTRVVLAKYKLNTIAKASENVHSHSAAQPQPRPSMLRRATSGPSGLCRWQRRVYGARVCYPRTSARPLRRRSTLTSCSA